LGGKLGPNHPDTLTSSQNLAHTYLSAMADQVWLGKDKEYSKACRGALELAKGSEDAVTLERCAKACSFPSGGDTAHLAEALTLARKALKLGNNHGFSPWFHVALGMCEFRNGNWTEAEEALSVAMKNGEWSPRLWVTSAYYRAMNSFRRGKQDEARQLAAEATAKMMKLWPPPQAQKTGFWHDDVIIWMAYKEAKELLKLESTSPSSGQRTGK
jgi:tetratricopeptide (TPR) repeat protein